ncbi:putative minor capsid protein [Geomicrobium sp. JCM 19038]|uniref:putative minor capsid protein n=1 Tax=Geomicrobium sp. JCM 19038 TaxID=1460635 RepID=UPI00045F2C6C|nr:putative minor capsid protein [Geomicrobium sp. JCM 19038]GAK09624.1 phage capsid and scaffold [Geomicrobium sp. JCM 19038]
MVMPKPPADFCIDQFEYHKFIRDGWNGAEYEEPVIVKSARIDRGAEYSSNSSGKQLLYNGIVFCYEGITSPLPQFKTQSIIRFDGINYTITKVIPIYEAYDKVLYSYELEVI